jgi:hypothetical protein
MSKKKTPRPKTPGRKHDPNAKRRTATTVGARRFKAEPPERVARDRAALGDGDTGLDFPPDVLLTKGYITADMRDEALRFASLAWAIYGLPFASQASLYRQVVSQPGDELEARALSEFDRETLMKRQRRQLEAMTRVLGRVPECLQAVRAVAQHLQLPRVLLDRAAKRPSQTGAYSEIAALTKGLQALVNRRKRIERAAEERHPKPPPPAPPTALTTADERQRRQAYARACGAWFLGPLVFTDFTWIWEPPDGCKIP